MNRKTLIHEKPGVGSRGAGVGDALDSRSVETFASPSDEPSPKAEGSGGGLRLHAFPDSRSERSDAAYRLPTPRSLRRERP